MTNLSRVAGLLALTSIALPAAAQPRHAGFETKADGSAAERFMFAGATVRLPLNGYSHRQPELAMRMAGGSRSPTSPLKIGDGIAFTAVPGATPKLTLGGHETNEIARRLEISSGAKTALIVGGVVVAALVVVTIVGVSDMGPSPD